MAAAPYTLAELLTGQSRAQLQARFLALLGMDPSPNVAGNLNHGFPVSDWLSNPNGMELAFVKMVKDGIFDLVASGLPPKIAARFLGKATGDWLTYLAKKFYVIDRNQPTKTTFNLDVTAAASASTNNFAPGDLWVQGASGLRYVSTSGGTLPGGGTIVIAFEAEAAGEAYSDNPALIAPSLVTAPAGVTVTGHAGDFGEPIHSGAGTGHLKFFAPGNDNPPAPGTYAFRVDLSGDPGTALFSMSIDGGGFFGVGPMYPNGDLGPYLIYVTPVAGAGSPASFLLGDVYTVQTPGGPAYVQGSNAETDASLVARCRARWPSLSLNQTADVFELWAKLAYPPANRVSVRADPQASGFVQLVVADSHGGIDPASAAAINAFITPKLGSVLDHVSVAGAQSRVLAVGGVVTVNAIYIGAIQQTVQQGWADYLASVPIGRVVLLSELEQIIMDAGAIDVTGLQIAGAATNYVLDRDEVPIAGDLTGAPLTWSFG